MADPGFPRGGRANALGGGGGATYDFARRLSARILCPGPVGTTFFELFNVVNVK